MTGEADETTEEPEHNYYLDHLQEWRDTVLPNARDAVVEPGSSPESDIATKIAAGWQCTAADEWLEELHTMCTPITGAFDDAIADCQAAAGSQPEEVPAGHEHGNAYRDARHRSQPSGGRWSPQPI